MTEIGGTAPISEASVQAGNWMTALKAARRAIGESGGVPPGASCSVAPDGSVTIQDAVARKTYSLSPSAVMNPSPGPARRSSVPPPSAVMRSARQKAKKKRPSSTIAYNAKDLGIAALAAQANRDASARPSPQRTIAYNAQELGIAGAAEASATAVERTAAVERSTETVAHDPQGPHAAVEKKNTGKANVVVKPPKRPKKKKKASRTIAYNAAQLGFDVPSPKAIAKPAAKKKTPARAAGSAAAKAPARSVAKPKKKRKVAPQTIAYNAKGMNTAGVGAEPAASTSRAPANPAAPAPAAPKPSATPPAERSSGVRSSAEEVGRPTQPGPICQLLHSRDAEPSAESPLTYRERVYFIAPGPSAHVLEAMLLARFDELRSELSDRPKGKLANLALFDHAWTGRPERPPLMTLQWKDWRGEPVLTRTPAASSGAPQPSTQASTPAPAETAAVAAPPSAPPEPAPPPAAPAAPTAAASPAASPRLSAPPPAAAEPEPTSKTDDRLASAFEALQDLFFLTSPVEGVEFALALLQDLVPSEAMSACLYDINADELRFVSLTGPGSEERRGEGVPRLSGILGTATLSPGRTVVVNDVSTDVQFDPGVDGRVGLTPETIAAVALTHQGRLLGALQLVNRQTRATYSSADANLIFYVGEKLAEFLHSVHLRPSSG